MSLLEEQPRRMAQEKRLLDEYARTEEGVALDSWVKLADGGLAVNFRFKLLRAEFKGLLVYPRLFPDVPAFVKPAIANEHWSTHQFGGPGVLCLEIGPDNWCADLTGPDLLRSARKLLWAEELKTASPRTAPPIESRHQQSSAQVARFFHNRFVVTADFAEFSNDNTQAALVPIKAVSTALGLDRVFIPVLVGEAYSSLRMAVPASLDDTAQTVDGWLVRSGSAPPRGAPTVETLKAQLAGLWASLESSGETKLLVTNYGDGTFRAVAFRPSEVATFQECAVIACGDEKDLRLPTEFRTLAEKTIAVVGLGSLGSKIAVSLARAGVGRFLLFDDDVLKPENLVRTELDWAAVGHLKVFSVAERIQKINPLANVDPLTIRLGGYENPELTARYLSRLADCDLVIDATASSMAFTTLAATCKRLGVRMVWGELFAGGGGALMARSRPGLDASPLEVRGQIFEYLKSLPPAPSGKAHRYALSEDDQVLVGSDADVTALAASLVQFAVDTLNSSADSVYPHTAYLIGYRRFWIFQEPFDTRPIDCGAATQAEATKAPMSPDEEKTLVDLNSQLETNAATNRAS